MKYKHGGDVYTHQGVMDFSANVTPFGISDWVKQAVIDSLDTCDCYPDAACRQLKKELAAFLRTKEEYLVMGNGAADVIFALALAQKPKKALLMAPTFGEYEQALRAVNCEIREYTLLEEEGFLVTERYVDALQREIAGGVEMIFLCSPDNPSGNLIAKPLLKEILQICAENRVRMVLDESFWQFAYESAEETMQEALAAYPQLFLLRSFTKMFGMAGLRLGYGMTSDEELRERIEQVRQPWTVSIPAQAAGIAALQERDSIAEIRVYVGNERAWMQTEFEKLGLTVFPGKANYLLIKTAVPLYETLLKEHRILIRNCDTYHGFVTESEGDSIFYYRIAVKLHEENAALMKALGHLLAGQVVDL